METVPYSNTTTSLEAAVNLDQDTRVKMRQAIYDFIRGEGMFGATDQEIEDATGIKGDTVRPRRGELLKDGLIKYATFKRKTRSNRNAQVWVAVK